MRCGAPVAHVSNPLRGPPWKSIDEIESLATQTPGKRQVVAEARESARPLDDDDLVDARMMAHDRRGRRFDEIGDAGAGNRRRMAPIAGVVKTTSPIRRNRTSRMFS